MRDSYYIIDAHCHVYPADIAAKASTAIGVFYNEIPDCTGTPGDALSRNRLAGIDRVVIESAATVPHQVTKINDFIASTVANNPARFIGFGTLHPLSEQVEADVRHLCDLGLRGVKMHNDFMKIPLDTPEMHRVFDLCAEAKLPVLLHAGDRRFDYTNPNRLAEVLRRHPTLTVIGAHFAGYSVWEEAARTLLDFNNLVVDCSSSLRYLGPVASARLIRMWGAERVLFGTDFPFYDPLKEIFDFFKLPLTDGERRLILSQNVERLLHLKSISGLPQERIIK